MMITKALQILMDCLTFLFPIPLPDADFFVHG